MFTIRTGKSLAILLSLLFASCANSQVYVVAGYTYPPFMDQAHQQGIYHDLIQALQSKLPKNIELRWEYYPYARLDYMFESGRVHLEVGSSPLWTQNKAIPGIYTQEFYTLSDVEVTQPEYPDRQDFRVDHDVDRIGIVRGYAFPQFNDLFKSGQAIRVDAKDEKQLLDMLFTRRLQKIFISKELFLYHQSKNNKFNTLKMGSVIGRYEVAIRIHPNAKELLPLLNRAINQLQTQGRIQAIVERHVSKQ